MSSPGDWFSFSGWPTLSVLMGWGATQIQSAEQLRVCSDNYGGKTHRNCTHAHGHIKPPSDEKASGDWNGDQVISSRPNEILDHFPVGCARKLDGPDDIARIAAYKNDSSRFNRYIGSRPDSDSHIRGRQCWCVVHAVADHCYALAACLKILNCHCLVGGENIGCDLISPATPSNGSGNRPSIS